MEKLHVEKPCRATVLETRRRGSDTTGSLGTKIADFLSPLLWRGSWLRCTRRHHCVNLYLSVVCMGDLSSLCQFSRKYTARWVSWGVFLRIMKMKTMSLRTSARICPTGLVGHVAASASIPDPGGQAQFYLQEHLTSNLFTGSLRPWLSTCVSSPARDTGRGHGKEKAIRTQTDTDTHRGMTM
ncbi:uncharacterized protein LOC123626883 isoform X4 [Lemur catta]|uniref:uncharacterized protein LOC123626883 isoform X4 n=1 Tax=Lemur catta TaxID=9447 RepID=UPI001E266A52|nr:uncharacterized protein LOC123626883 isoform X4 [Lemur catta]